jgi:DNA replication protein DnaC
MSEFSYENIEKSTNVLRLSLSISELAKLSEEHSLTADQMAAFDMLLEYLREKKIQTTIDTLHKMSRLPLKNPRTFDNFDFSVIKGKDVEKLKALPSLAAIHAHKNLAFIGPAGIGKTHLAQAFGYECCQQGLKTYFIKMSELRDRFTSARRNGKEASVLNGLVRPSCLIIDEVGHCEFDKENTRLFFDMIDRRYNKDGSYNIVFTSNKNPSQWREIFNEDDALLCALDRIFDDATVFTIRGQSYRGRKLEKISLQAGKVPKKPTKADSTAD